MANIIQIQDDLKNISDQALVNFVKKPTGQVPSYLALGELKRRKETREKYQGEKAQQKTTVAEDLVKPQGIGSQMTKNSMPQPTAGVGSPQPVNPAMLASKGIGQLNPGAVNQMNDGGIVGFKTGEIVQAQQRKNAQRFLGSELGFEDGSVAYPLGTAIGDALSYLNPLSYMDMYNAKVDPVKGRVVGGVGDRFADTKAEIKRREKEKKDIIARMDADEKIEKRKVEVAEPLLEDDYTVSSRQPVTEYVPGLLTNSVYDIKTEAASDKNKKDDTFVATNLDVTDTVKTNDVSGADKVIDKVTETETLNTKLDIDDLDMPRIISKEQEELFSGRSSNRPKELTTEEAINQVLETNKKAGLLSNPFDQDRKDLEKERELLDKAKSDAGSMAFIKAGLLWMKDGNLGDAAPAVTEYEQALKGLRGEDRELKKMDLALKGADMAYKQGNAKAARDLTVAAQNRLDTFDRDTFTTFNQALIAGYQGRTDILKANLAKDTQIATAQLGADAQLKAADMRAKTSEKVARIGAGKLQGKPLLFEILSENPDYQKADGSVDAAKIMKDISPPSSMYAAQSKPAQFMAQWNATVEKLSAQPDMETRLTTFLEKYPDPVSFANAMGAGSGMATYSTKGGYKPAGS